MNPTTNISTRISTYRIETPFQIWLFFIVDLSTLVCTLFVLYHLIADRTLRTALHNHAVIIILILTLAMTSVDIPLQLQFYITGSVRPATDLTCRFWWLIDWANSYIIGVLLLFASIERHILIFHSALVATFRKRLIFHYIPLSSVITFMLIFYGIAIFSPICTNSFNFTANLCGLTACYQSMTGFVMIEQIGFGALSYILIVVFNMTLVIRVIKQKYRLHRIVQWSKQRRLVLQMIALSSLFFFFSAPVTIIYIVRLVGPTYWGESVLSILYYLSYYAILLLPFVCLGNIPQLKQKLIHCIPRYRRIATLAI